jgi:putative transposase
MLVVFPLSAIWVGRQRYGIQASAHSGPRERDDDTHHAGYPWRPGGPDVVMDNLSSHKNKAVRHATRAVGAKLFYLPPDSPDQNPIEQASSNLKTLLPKENARTVERIEEYIARLIQQIDPAKCLNYFQQAEYSPT